MDTYIESWNAQAELSRIAANEPDCRCSTCDQPCGNHSSGCEECLEYAMEARHYGHFSLPDDDD